MILACYNIYKIVKKTNTSINKNKMKDKFEEEKGASQKVAKESSGAKEAEDDDEVTPSETEADDAFEKREDM